MEFLRTTEIWAPLELRTPGTLIIPNYTPGPCPLPAPNPTPPNNT